MKLIEQMKVEQKGHTTIIKDTEGNLSAFLEKIQAQYHSFKETNLILDISHDKTVTLERIAEFVSISEQHKANGKSFVLVAEGIDFNEVPEDVLVVPTLLEAHDMIEMEEIERDLGF